MHKNENAAGNMKIVYKYILSTGFLVFCSKPDKLSF